MSAYSEDFKDEYIKIFIKNGFSVTKAVKACNIDWKTHYEWLKKPEFKKKFEQAKKQALDQLIEESEHTHRVLRLGIPKKDKDGTLTGWEEKPDGRAIEWFLSKRSPDYSDKLNINHTSDVNFADVIKGLLSGTTTETITSNTNDIKSD